MTALDHRSHTIGAGTSAAAVVTRVGDGLLAVLRAVWRRREVNRLAELSDHALDDIGLTRADLASVRQLPVTIDPTLRLDAMVRERLISAEDAARRVC